MDKTFIVLTAIEAFSNIENPPSNNEPIEQESLQKLLNDLLFVVPGYTFHQIVATNHLTFYVFRKND